MPRAGFFERHQYDAVRRHLRPDLAAVVAIAYNHGWRVHSERLTIVPVVTSADLPVSP